MKTIGIAVNRPSDRPGPLFEALGAACGVSFVARTFGDDRGLDGWVVLEADRRIVREIERATRPCFVVPADSELVGCGPSSTIGFTTSTDTDGVLRGREIAASDAVEVKALPDWLPDGATVARKAGARVWTVHPRGCYRHHVVAFAPPELQVGEPLFMHFCGARLVRLLPLLLFVRSLLEEGGWQPPPLQATFMFDDPNLHWTSYGFIDYREMVSHASAGNYHVSIATIPLDGWLVHPAARAIFTSHAGQMSLLCHGNDHVSNELARPTTEDAMRRTLRQALGRIARLEARTGLEVARVMAPPHGACREVAFAEMARLGFEAACVSRGSLRFHNDGASWTQIVGLKPCDVVAGLPVIPRFGLSAGCRNDILIAALLRQPIIPMTHHQALADGYRLLDETAGFVNSLGQVRWRSLNAIARSLYSWRQDGDQLLVRMFSKHVSVPIPPGVARMSVERPWLDDPSGESLTCRAAGQTWQRAGPRGPIAVEPGWTVDVASRPTAVDPAGQQAAGVGRLVPVARRLLTEGRDRALPSIHRLARRGTVVADREVRRSGL